ncbi:hypothetical protein H7K24_14200 [Mycobacterium fragae]|uniref:DUF3558 domain-containing protein n=1 Tax=Mycobacterium fragae TaxID=1260918 RepID=A0A1X1UIV0_9MYCO|nr:hypothetical protein [Mycobacterium fragae]MCV7401305.1 hypothetical protein [Mycobacterium fragae]ORV56776.1 hypothetical protein AWC06_00745 [Mycobacterium fragae]
MKITKFPITWIATLVFTAATTATLTAVPVHATNLDQLVAAVCDMTTYVEGKSEVPGDADPLPESAFEAGCLARTTRNALFIGRYTSEPAVQHDLTHLSDFYRKAGAPPNVVEDAKRGGGTYVLVPMPNGTAVLFEDPNNDDVGLSPLQAFGFAISPNPPQV